MAKLYNLAGMSTATTGTGTITLGSAMYGHLTFAQAGVSDGDLVSYAVKDGAASEVGYGVYTSSGTTLTRTVRKSTNSNSAINLSGSAEVLITPAAEDFLPVSSGAELGFLTNPFFEISQENGTTLKSAIGATNTYAADQWFAVEDSDAVCSTQNVASPFSSTATLKRLRSSIKTIATTADGTIGAAQYIHPCTQTIEGTYWRSLAWGTGDARAVDVVLIAQCSVTGTYPVAITSAAGNRSYVSTVSLTANTPKLCLVRFPGDTGGTWVTTDAASAKIYIGSVGGSDYQASALDTWEAAGKFTHSSCTNWAASGTTDFFQVGYCQIFPAGVLPWSSASEITGEALQQLLNIRRPYGDELRRCQRYWEASYNLGTAPGTATTDGICVVDVGIDNQSLMGLGVAFSVEKRAAPAVTLYDAAGASGFVTHGANGKTAVARWIGTKRFEALCTEVAGSPYLQFHFAANARL